MGEFGLIDRIRSRLGDVGLDGADDAAVLPPGEGHVLLTTDALVEGVDFDRAYCSGGDVGYKAISVNVSDVAAMGGRPTFAVVALALPPGTPVAVVDGITDGIVEAATGYGLRIAGGDISRAGSIALSVALLGETPAPVRRSGARAGDDLWVTGTLGAAAGGLVVLRGGLADPAADGVPASAGDALARLARRQLRPTARVEEGRRVAASGATAMIDVSDGLVADLGHLLAASGLGCAVDVDAVPVDPDLAVLATVVEGLDPIALALTGGEDLELLFAAPPARAGEVRRAGGDAGGRVTRIGSLHEGPATVGGRPLESWREAGWDHLHGR